MTNLLWRLLDFYAFFWKKHKPKSRTKLKFLLCWLLEALSLSAQWCDDNEQKKPAVGKVKRGVQSITKVCRQGVIIYTSKLSIDKCLRHLVILLWSIFYNKKSAFAYSMLHLKFHILMHILQVLFTIGLPKWWQY
jgi:hypothetical protein